MKVTGQNLHLDHQQWPNVVLPIQGKIAGSDAFLSKLVFFSPAALQWEGKKIDLSLGHRNQKSDMLVL